jgi:hypothetical protein
LRELGSIYWPCIAGQTVFPVQTAVRYQVPLIIWGAHQGIEQVGMFSHENEVEMTRRYRKDHDLMGFEADDLLSIFNTVTEDDIWQYRYPDDHSLNIVGVRGIYLGNYVRWDPKSQHEKMVKMYGYQGSRFSRTFDTYDHVDCHNFMHLHDHLKYIKHGYTKVTDHACREIRHGRLSRGEALALIGFYENQPAHHLNLFCEWLNIHPQSLTFMVDQHRNKKVWIKQDVHKWNIIKKNDPVNMEISETTKIVERLGFEVNQSNNCNLADRYITVGKGWPI